MNAGPDMSGTSLDHDRCWAKPVGKDYGQCLAMVPVDDPLGLCPEHLAQIKQESNA